MPYILQGLRHHKADLEERLNELQTARRDLMIELDELMKLLKVNAQPPMPQQIGGMGMGVPPQSLRAAMLAAAGGSGIPTASNSGGRVGGHGSGGGHFDDITDVSGLGIERAASNLIKAQNLANLRVVANEDSVNSVSSD